MTSRIANGAAARRTDSGHETGGQEVIVGLAEIRVAKGPANFAFIGLGSGIGLCALDPVANVGGAAHIMLPKASINVLREHLGKFADTAVGELVRLMEEAGAKRENIMAAYAGGANVADFPEAASKLDIGSRNLAALESELGSLKIPVKGLDAGGTVGRTLKLATITGDVTVKTIKIGEARLCSLRG